MKESFTSILNVHVSNLTYNKAINDIESWIKTGKRHYICVANVHLVMECQKDKKLLNAVNKACLVTPDGMPLVWLSRLYGRKKIERVYGPTLTIKVCKLASKKGYSIFLLGGKKGRSRELTRVLKQKFPALSIAGAEETPIRPIPAKKNAQIIKKINRSKANIVLVGMGCPFQEQWMSNNTNKLSANILIGVGAAFDFITKRVKQAPEWMQKAGLEWLFRFFQEPKRLAYRYTTLNILFIFAISKQLIYNFVFKRK